MNFIEKILSVIENLGDFLGNLFTGLVDFLTKPLALLLALLEGIFYFITKIFQIVILVVTIFVRLFQYFFRLVGSLLNTVTGFANFSPSSAYYLPSASRQGFQTALQQIGGTGLLTVVPLTFTAILWLLLIYKLIQLLGDDKS